MICETCKQDVPDPEFTKKVSDILGPNLRLYDFGAGTILAPLIDKEGVYLTSSVFYIHEWPLRTGTKFYGVIIGLRYRTGSIEDQIISALPEAKKQFPSLARSVEGDRLPEPVRPVVG